MIVLAVIAWLALIGAMLCAWLIKAAPVRLVTAMLFGGVVLITALFAGKLKGEENARLPNLAGLCRTDTSVSWKVSGSDFEKTRHALQEDAKCSGQVNHLPTPSAFPKH